MGCDSSTDYRQILLAGAPLLDVRSPIEFQRGSLPAAVNIPLLNDEERHAVGLCYRQNGPQQAIALGYKLLGNGIREQRLAQWRTFCLAHPKGYLYCFRGGQRSGFVQQWLKDEGIDYPRIRGGYKAMRHYLLELLQQAATFPMMLIGGNTGCGKTRLIQALPLAVDLEGLARHRGSSFGRTLVKQSGQVDFEHRLAITLLAKQSVGIACWIVEDEGRTIGSNHIPPYFYQQMQQSPVVVIEDPFELRLQRLLQEYIQQMRHDFRQAKGEEQGWQAYCDYLYQGLFAIRNRLGLERYQALLALQNQALERQLIMGDDEQHLTWLAPLLRNYYDPMYTYQLNNKADRIIFRGNYAEVKGYLLSNSTPLSCSLARE